MTADRTLGAPRFYLPEVARSRSGPRAPLITTAGLAGATAAGRHAHVHLATGPVTVAELLDRAVVHGGAPGSPRRRSARPPDVAVTAAKDARLVAEAKGFRRDALRRLEPGARAEFVWQRHEAFHDVGSRVARSLGAPYVASVHALKIREARSWGVRRPGWGGLLERVGERFVLRQADLITCVTDEVAAQVADLTGGDDNVVVVANGVDTEVFCPGPPDPGLLERLELRDRFVVGWTGSFRSFHAIEHLLDALCRLQDVDDRIALLLVGDGERRATVEQTTARLRLRDVRFAGAVAFDDVPRYLRLMDVCVVPAAAAGSYHYSPTKLREYMACGRAVVAADRGEMGRAFGGGGAIATVPPGRAGDLASMIDLLRRDPDRRQAMGHAARQRTLRTESWCRRLEAIRAALPTE